MNSQDNMVSKNEMESKMNNTALRLTSIMMIFFTYLVSGQRPATEDTWVLSSRDRYVLTYTVALLRTPRVTWWWKSTAHNSMFQQLEYMNMGNFRETVTPAVNENPDGSILYDVRLEISNINSSIFGKYRVDINGEVDLTRYFTVNEMLDRDKTLNGLSETPTASVGDDKFGFSESHVSIAVGVAVGILMVVTIIAITLIVRKKTKKPGRTQSPVGIQTDNNSGEMSISSDHYTDAHSTVGDEGLGENLDRHEYQTTLNTAGRRFSDSTSEREKSITFENVAKNGHSCENCNHSDQCTIVNFGQLNAVPDDSELNRLSAKIGKEFETLARFLGIDDGEIFQIRSDHPYDTRSQIYHILARWKQKSGIQATYHCLEKAFRNSDIDVEILSGP